MVDSRLSNGLGDRVAALRAEGRRRRRLVQLPPLVSGVASGLTGVILVAQRVDENSSLSWLPLVGITFIHLGPWLAILSLRPQDRRLVRGILAFCVLLGASGAAVVAGQVVVNSRVPGVFSQRGFMLSVGADCLVIAACVAGCALWLRALAHDLYWSAPARDTFARLFHAMGVLYAPCGCAYGGYAMVAFRFPSVRTFVRSDGPPLALLAIVVFALGCSTFWQPLRTSVQELLVRIGEGVSAAAGIAELIGGLPPEEVLARAKATFRAVPAGALLLEHFERPAAPDEPPRRPARQPLRGMGGGSAVTPVPAAARAAERSDALALCEEGEAHRREHGAPSNEAPRAEPAARAAPNAAARFAVSAPAQIGSVDAFISHSWHDDARLKFAAVQAWRHEFAEAHGRDPTVWLDACCIDQANIQAQLPSLPIYLAGCKSVLALHGPTYFERLWCVLELHIFHQMGGSIEQIHFSQLGGGDGAQPATEGATARPAPPFDVRRASAVDPHDQTRLLAVIEGSGEGISAFNEWVHSTLLPAAVARRQTSNAAAAGDSQGKGYYRRSHQSD